jgi:hypothetical protein
MPRPATHHTLVEGPRRVARGTTQVRARRPMRASPIEYEARRRAAGAMASALVTRARRASLPPAGPPGARPASAPSRPERGAPVDWLAHVAAGLSQHPQAWVGRTINVRATALRTGHIHGTYAVRLIDHWPLRGRPAAVVWVSATPASPPFAYLALTSVVAQFLPGWQYHPLEGVYRIRLSRQLPCPTPLCIVGQLQ